MVEQGNGLQASRRGCGVVRMIGCQQLHKGRGDLFSGPPGALSFEPVPVAFANGKLALQGRGQLQGLGGPAVGGGGAGVRNHGPGLMVGKWLAILAR